MTLAEWPMAIFLSAVLAAGSVYEFRRGNAPIAGILTGVAVYYWITVTVYYWITS